MCYLHLKRLGAALLCLLGLSAQAALYTFNSGFANGGVIPDRVGTSGPSSWTDTRNLTTAFGSGYTITDLNVTINVTSGYNGDLVARLDYVPTGGGSGYVVLLNRVGRDLSQLMFNGYSTPGFNNVTLDDSATTDIHVYGGGLTPPTGSYQPDGRTASPTAVTTGSSRDTSLATFNGMNANGTWTLTFTDWAANNTSTLTSWSLNIEAVPEPITTALIIFGVIFGCFQFVRYLRARRTRLA